MAAHAITATPAPASNSWAKLLAPSLSDLLFIFVLFWSFLAAPGGWDRLLMDADTGFHIRAGQLMLDTGRVPASDPFTFLKTQSPWYAFEWLAQITFGFLHSEFGLKGVVLLAGVAIVATFVILLRLMLQLQANGLIAMGLTLVAINASSVHFHARPHIFTLLFLAVSVSIVLTDVRAPSWRIWLLVPLTLVWVNVHGGFMLLFVLLGCRLLSKRRQAIRYARVLGACGLMSFLNPNGLALHRHVIGFVSSRTNSILNDEFKAPDFRSEAHLYFIVILFLALGIVYPLLQQRKWPEALTILVFAYSSLMAVRQIAPFAIVAIPIIAMELTALLRDKAIVEIGEKISRQARWTSVWPAAMLLFLAFSPSVTWPQNLPASVFPVEMIRRHGPEIAGARLFTVDQWANYAIYTNPAQRVFIDSQHQIYGDKVLLDALKMMEARPGWREALKGYGIDAVLCPVDAPIASLLEGEPGWRLVDKVQGAVLFERKPTA